MRALFLTLLLSLCPARSQTTPAPDLPREFRGVWVATVDNIDWPSKPGLPVAEQKAELDRILDLCQRLRLNAVVFQVRPGCDALYRSELEPWSEWLNGRQGKAPEPMWDPLEHAVAGAHARALELHAWFNPYRARPAKASSSAMAAKHVSQAHPDWVVTYGKQLWMDPGNEQAEAHTLRVIADVVRRYDIDGVHMDDYFYPYPLSHPEKKTEFPDDASFQTWRRKGGNLARDDWRRANVDRLVQRIGQTTHELKPWVKFGISPFGVARPGLPPGITAGIDQHSQLYADAHKWLRLGWCDYFAPQLYWPIAQRAQSYPVLLQWWTAENVAGRHLWPGNFTSKLMDAWKKEEILEQVRLTRLQKGASGNIHFSMKALLRDFGGITAALETGPYAQPALVPASPWLDRVPPGATRLRAERSGKGVQLSWDAVEDGWQWAVLGSTPSGWTLLEVVPRATLKTTIRGEVIGQSGLVGFAVVAVDRCGNQGLRAEARLP